MNSSTPSSAARPRERPDAAAEEDALFVEFRRTGSRRLRNELVERHMGLAAHVARRFGRRGPSDDDLRQVAFLALVKAVDRFEPDRNVAFSTFAGRTIEGEIKRHFRDHTWTVRVPRSAKEIHLRLRRATDELTQRLGRSPTVAAARRAPRHRHRRGHRGHRRRLGLHDGQPRRARPATTATGTRQIGGRGRGLRPRRRRRRWSRT